MNVLRVSSNGGGVQSTAGVVAQAMGLVDPFDVHVFAHVGEDSENPATLAYVHEHVIPFAEKHGIRFEVIRKMRKGEPDSVYQSVMRDNGSIPIPVILNNGAFGNRTCTSDFKVRAVDSWIKRQGYTHAEIALWISLDEYRRARFDDDFVEQKRPVGFWKRRIYPLIDLRMTRAMCYDLIAEAGLPRAPKSSCYFCPFQTRARWIELRREQPELFERACQLDEYSRDKRRKLKLDDVWFHPSRRPLRDAVAEQPRLFDDDDDSCDSGYCMT